MSNAQVYCARMPDGAVCSQADLCRSSYLFVLSQIEDALRNRATERMSAMMDKNGLLRQVAINIRNETLLSCRFWRDLITAISQAEKRAFKVRDAIRAHMRKACFLAPRARVPLGTIFGRVTTRDELKSHFMRSGYFGEDLFALQNIEEVMGVPVEEGRAKWELYDLGRYVMWATFDPKGGRPFAKTGSDVKRLRGRLGLDRSQHDKPGLILEYVLDTTGVHAHFATVAEAYASDPWISHFRPVGPDEEAKGYGMTQPTEEYEKFAGLPEVVHAPIKGSALAYQPRELE